MEKKDVKLTEKQAAIWNDIKDKEVEYYTLPNMTIEGVCFPCNVDPDCLFVTLKGPAAIVSIEGALGKLLVKGWSGEKVTKYIIEARDKFVVISENPAIKAPVKSQ